MLANLNYICIFLLLNTFLNLSKGTPLAEESIKIEGERVKCGSTKDLGPDETITFVRSGRDPCRLRLIANRCRVGIQCNSRSLWGKSLSDGECINILEITGENGIEKVCLDDQRQARSINIRGPTLSLNLAPPNVNRITQPTNLFQTIASTLSRCSVSCQRVDAFSQGQGVQQTLGQTQTQQQNVNQNVRRPIESNSRPIRRPTGEFQWFELGRK